MIKNTEWTRECPNPLKNPKCLGIQTYASKGNFKRAVKGNSVCYSCNKFGTIPSEETKEKISKNMSGENNHQYGKKRPDHSERMKGKNNPFYNKKHTMEVKLKNRLYKLNELKKKHGQLYPNYNPRAIPIIEQKAKELGILDLQHAENGGEFHIKELGYWVDGYSKEKNIIIEYYEPFHKKQVERDKLRKQEIINHLGCEFIE